MHNDQMDLFQLFKDGSTFKKLSQCIHIKGLKQKNHMIISIGTEKALRNSNIH